MHTLLYKKSKKVISARWINPVSLTSNLNLVTLSSLKKHSFITKFSNIIFMATYLLRWNHCALLPFTWRGGKVTWVSSPPVFNLFTFIIISSLLLAPILPKFFFLNFGAEWSEKEMTALTTSLELGISFGSLYLLWFPFSELRILSMSIPHYEYL